ncbi:hippurate hydrolase [Fusobacterium naviforme]|nr:amidohydrolase [Fusobacterium naviforme]PSL10143.1 hippurate hydrolase [Fusobacterium naviforme]STO27552.1 Uncharacterized hydrolase YxeP [Fusobacterium naviforme]
MQIKRLIDQYAAEAVEWRREIHRNPELSMEETATTAFIRDKLQKWGISIRDSGIETGIIAEIDGSKSGKNRVAAVRADIDALPVQERGSASFASVKEGVCHACGHDLHTASLLLTARVLSENRNLFSGKVRLLFQPAEESGAGARIMIEHGALEAPKPDVILGIHTWPDTPAGMIGTKSGPSHASSDTVKIVVRGRGGHGAHPYRCVDPVVAASYLITEMQTILSREVPMNEGVVLTFGSIHGGTASNVIPDQVVIEGTLRTLSETWRKNTLESIRRIARGCCEAMKAEAEVIITEGMPPLINVPEVIALVEKAADQALGEGHVMHLPSASPGSDDFARYLEFVPGALYRMGTGNDDPDSHIGLHNGKNVFDERGIATAAAVTAQFLIDYLQ